MLNNTITRLFVRPEPLNIKSIRRLLFGWICQTILDKSRKSKRKRNTMFGIDLKRILLLLLLLRSQLLHAFPTGGGGCGAGDYAVAGIHRSRSTVVNATFAETGISLTFGGNKYLPGSTIPSLPGVEYVLSVDTNGEAFFRGIFIRVQAIEGQDMTSSLTAQQNTIRSNSCLPPYVAGLSHYDATIKGTASGRFLCNSPGRVRLDINVVIGNEPELSIWGYANFIIDIVDIGIPIVPSTFAPAAPVAAEYSPAVSPTNLVVPTGTGEERGRFFYIRKDDF
jgi:hypothetical protein